MLVANFTTVRPEMGNTRTYEDFSKFLGERPHRFGLVSRLYPNYTATFLTESLRNVFIGDNKRAKGFQSVDSTYFEWDVETNYIKKLPIIDIVGNGANGTEFTITFGENYYQYQEIFKIEETEDQCMVVAHPVRKSDKAWDVTVRFIDNDYSTSISDPDTLIGTMTRFIGNAKPEMHDVGFVKYLSNIEKMRNYMTEIRVLDSYSSKYALMEDTFIKIGKGEGQGNMTEKIYKLDPMKKNLIDNFMMVRENMMLMAKTNIDVNGKATIADRYTNRPIPVGEGMIPQIERFASKYSANNFTINTFLTVMTQMARKAESATGNHFLFVVNLPAWDVVQRVLGNYLSTRRTDGAYLWSRGGDSGKSKYVKVGATFDSYEWGGNIISFKHDDTLTREYSEPFFLCIDLTTGKTSTQPPVAMFTLANADFILNEIEGVGGSTGKKSGIVSSPVAGGSMIASGWCGIAVFNPYRSFILRGLK